MRRVCAPGGGRGAWPSARRSPTATWPASAAGSSTSSRPSSTDDLLYQLAALDGIARVAGTRVSYVKPHGALYNAAVTHDGPRPGGRRRRPRLRPPAAGPRPARLGAAALGRGGRACARSPRASPTAATRRTARWCPAREPGALVHDPAAVAERAVRMAADGVVVAVDGTRAAHAGRVGLRARRHPGRGRAGPGGARRRSRPPGVVLAPVRRLTVSVSRPPQVVGAQPAGEQVRGDVVDGPAARRRPPPRMRSSAAGAPTSRSMPTCPWPPRPPPGAGCRAVQPLRPLLGRPRRPDRRVAQRGA